MKKLIVMSALAFVSSFSFADEAVTAEAYSNALQVVRAWNKEHPKTGKKDDAKIQKEKNKVDREYAKRLGVSERALDQMKRRIQVLNATTNRPVESVIESYKAKAGFRTKLKEAEGDASYTREIQKAMKKSTKAHSKIVKTIEKERAKATDPAEIELLDALLSVLCSVGWTA